MARFATRPLLILLVSAVTLAGIWLETSTVAWLFRTRNNPVSSKAIPPDFRTLAGIFSMGIKASPSEFKDDKPFSEVMADGHAMIMALRNVKSSDPDINYVADQGQRTLSELYGRLEKINALPKPAGADESFVLGFIDGYFGNFSGAYYRTRDAEDKQNAINVELQACVAALEKTDALYQLIPNVAEKYSATPTPSNGRFVVDFDESWGAPGPDWFSIYNNGAALEDCTIVVDMTGRQSQTRKNVHYIKNWPAKTWMYSKYIPGRQVGKKVFSATVNDVDRLEISIYSPQVSTAISYSYRGVEKDKKIAERCKGIKLLGGYRPFESGFLWNTERAAVYTLEGIPSIGKCKVQITFRRGSQSKSWYWDLESWAKGQKRTFGPPKGELTFDPQDIDIVITFPDTAYKHKLHQKI